MKPPKRQCATMLDAACCDGRCSALRWPVQRTASSFPSFCAQPPAALPSAFYGREKSSPWKRNFFPKGQGGFLYSPVVASPTACRESGFAQGPIYIMYRRGLELCSRCMRFCLGEGQEPLLPTEQERPAEWCWVFHLPLMASHPGPRASGRAGAHAPWKGLGHRRRDRATTSVLSCQ